MVRDSGRANYVYFSVFRDGGFHFYTYMLENRIVKDRGNHWMSVSGCVTRGEFQMIINDPAIEEDREFAGILEDSLKPAGDFAEKLVKKINLNRFRKTESYRSFYGRNRDYSKIWNIDFNSVPFRRERRVICADKVNMLAAIDCGSFIFLEDPLQSRRLSLLVIYDLKGGKPLQLQIMENGYFLE